MERSNHDLNTRLQLYAQEHGFVYKDDRLYKIVSTPDEADEVLEVWERLQRCEGVK